MKKKILAVIMTAAMVMSFAACGSSSSSSSSAASSAAAESSAAEASAAEETSSSMAPTTWKFDSAVDSTNFQGIAWQEWADAVTEATDGALSFEFYWNDTLIDSNAAYQQLVAGIADIADVHRYASDGFVISENWKALMSGVPTDAVVEFSYKLWDEYEALRDEYKDVHVLAQAFNGGTVYQLLTVDKKVESPEDMKGLTIWCEADWNQFVTDCGATPVNTPWTEVYSSLQKHMYDGLMIADETLESCTFAEICKYDIKLDIAYLSAPGHLANLDKWNTLPTDIQDIVDSCASVAEDSQFNAFQQTSEDSIAWAEENYGTEVVELTDENHQAFMDILVNANLKTAASLDEQGLPGSDIVNSLAEWTAEWNG